MKINAGRFRLRDGDDVHLDKWPPTSRKNYRKQPGKHVAELSEQQLLYASNRHAVLLMFQAMDAAGQDGAIEHVMSGGQPAGLPNLQLQASQRRTPSGIDHDPQAACRMTAVVPVAA